MPRTAEPASLHQTHQVIDLGYRPREHQAIIHASLRRRNVLVCHRRFGKTELSVAELCHGALTLPHKMPRLPTLRRKSSRPSWWPGTS